MNTITDALSDMYMYKDWCLETGSQVKNLGREFLESNLILEI